MTTGRRNWEVRCDEDHRRGGNGLYRPECAAALLGRGRGAAELPGPALHRRGHGKRKLSIHGIPGNALGAYLNGAEIKVFGNAQDAVGDTMNAGTILIHGSIGDTAGYAMRGGKIYVRGSAGYRAGIHMKEY